MPRDVQVNLRLTEQARDVLAEASERHGMSMAQLASEAIVTYADALPRIVEARHHAAVRVMSHKKRAPRPVPKSESMR